MAAIINDRDALLSAAIPRLVNVNLPTSVNATTVGGASASTVVSNASTGASHAASTGNPHSADLDVINDGVTYFRTTANQRTGGGRAYNALNASDEYIKSLKSTQMTLVGSNPSSGVVMDANGIRMYKFGTLMVNLPATGDPYFDGDINSNGSANFSGSTSSGGVLYCGVFNDGGVRPGGLLAKGSNSSGFGVHGKIVAGDMLSVGVKGENTGGRGIEGSATSGTGVYATATTGDALHVHGDMSISSTAFVANLYADMAKQLKGQIGNFLTFQRGTLTGAATATLLANKPGSNSNNAWMEIKIDSTTLYVPVWT